MRVLSTFAAVALSAAMALPAAAQMKTSKPTTATSPAASSPAVAGVTAVATGEDEFRPTGFLGIERAQVLDKDAVVMGLGGSLNGSLGLGQGLEAGATANLGLGINPGAFNLPVGANAKMLLMKQGNFTVAGAARVDLGYNSALGSPFSIGASLMAPLSIWSVGPGDLHFMPTLNLGFSSGATFGAGVGVGYEMPLMAKWYFQVADTVLTTGNSLTVGTRVYLSPNLTADVGSITLSGTTISVNLISIGASFGGKAGAVHKAWGL